MGQCTKVKAITLSLSLSFSLYLSLYLSLCLSLSLSLCLCLSPSLSTPLLVTQQTDSTQQLTLNNNNRTRYKITNITSHVT